MATVFISHSSADNAAAGRLKAWLESLGYTDIFLDFDKNDGLRPGSSWKESLHSAIKRSHTVLALVSTHWMDSRWCEGEYTSAVGMGKTIIPIIIADTSTDGVNTLRDVQSTFGDIQFIDLRSDWEGNLPRLERTLDRSRVTPRAFPVAEDAAPYLGLNAYTEAAAGLYFGRELETRALLEALSRHRQGGAQLLLVLGASGAGKSSLLRAGLWPQLRLRPSEWIPVTPLTPDSRAMGPNAPIASLAMALSETFRHYLHEISAAMLQDRLGLEPTPVRNAALLNELRRAAGAPRATVVLGIDQAEEIFRMPRLQRSLFLQHVAAFLAAQDCLAVMTMRSDTFEEAQQARWFEKLAFEVFPVGPMPLIRVPDLIRGPASRTNFAVSEELVERASFDADTGDALPLLSLTFERLWHSHRGAKKVGLPEYETLGDQDGGVRVSPIENIVRFTADDELKGMTGAERTALVEAFIPGLVDLAGNMEAVRRVARWDEMPVEAQRPLEKLIEARLLRSMTESHVRTIDVSHEALLRRWPLMRDQIETAKPDLRLLQDVERAATDWHLAQEKGSLTGRSGLRISGDTLRRALNLRRRKNWQLRLGKRGNAYLDACAAADRYRLVKKVAAGTMLSLTFVSAAAWTVKRAWFEQQKAVLQTNMKEGQFGAALVTADKILSYDPDDKDALVAQASVSFYQRKFADAAELFEKVLAADPSDQIVMRNAADSWIEAGKPPRALELYMRLKPAPDLDYAIGRAYVYDGQFDEGLKRLVAVAGEVNKGSPHIAIAAAFAGKARATEDAGERMALLESARGALNKACMISPDHWNGVLQGKTRVQNEGYEGLIPLLRSVYGEQVPCASTCP